jgi:hypothetical protein
MPRIGEGAPCWRPDEHPHRGSHASTPASVSDPFVAASVASNLSASGVHRVVAIGIAKTATVAASPSHPTARSCCVGPTQAMLAH